MVSRVQIEILIILDINIEFIIINRQNNNKMGQQSGQSIVVLFLVAGFFYTFSYKLQGSQVVHEGNDGLTKTFFHPYMQGLIFFIGQSLCILLLYLRPTLAQKDNNAIPYSTTIFIIPAVSDLFSVMLQCTALALISGSTFMMLKGASIVTTLIFSRWLIQLEIRSRHIVGCGLAVVGLMVVGMADIWLSDKPTSFSSSQTQQTVGYVLMVVSLIFNGFLYAYEQKLLKQYTVSPLEMVGWEGVYGTVISFILVVILSFIPCPYPGNKCVYTASGSAYMEVPSVYLSQVFSSFPLLLLVVSGIFSNAFYNYYGVTITQTMDSLTRSLLNVCRTALIWLVGILISLYVGTNSPYKIQSLSLAVNFVKFVGFFCIILGTLTYNKITLMKYMNDLDQRWFKPNHNIQQHQLKTVLMQRQQYQQNKAKKMKQTN